MKGVQSAVRQALSKKDNVDDADRKPSGAVRGDSSDDEGKFEASMRKKVLEKRARLSESKGAGGSNKKKGMCLYRCLTKNYWLETPFYYSNSVKTFA